MTSPHEVLTAMYQEVRAGAPREARALWSDSGVWHVTGSHALAGDYDPDQYISFVQRLFRDYPDYRARANVQTTGGPSPGTVSGVLVVRVSEGGSRRDGVSPR